MAQKTHGTRNQQKTRRKELEDHLKNTNKEEPMRHPRPLGLTYLNLQRLNHQKQGNEEDKKREQERMRKICIQIYTREGFKWMGKTVSINHMAAYLSITPEQLLKDSNAELQRISAFFEGQEGRQFARGLHALGLQKSLEIMALCQSQTELLLAQQGNKYVAFLSAEVNKSLTNLIGAQKPFHDLIGRYNDKNPINIFMPNGASSGTSGKEYLSPEDALLLIQNNSLSMASNTQLIEAKEAELKDQIPDVNARNQDLTKIGIRIPNKVISKDGTQLHEVPDTLKAEDFIVKK